MWVLYESISLEKCKRIEKFVNLHKRKRWLTKLILGLKIERKWKNSMQTPLEESENSAKVELQNVSTEILFWWNLIIFFIPKVPYFLRFMSEIGNPDTETKAETQERLFIHSGWE